MNDKPFGHLTVEADKVAVQRGGVYHGGVLKATADGTATVEIYDGLDTNGELVDSFSAAASGRDRNVLEKGIDIREGLYVDIGSNVSAFTVYYDPPSGAER